MGKPVDARGWPYVEAQTFERLAEGALPDEPLLDTKPHKVTVALRDSRADLGLRLGGYVPVNTHRTPEENWEFLASRRFTLVDIR